MKKKNTVRPIAQRKLVYRGNPASIRLYAPVSENGGLNYRCDVEFVGLPPDRRISACGENSFQSLYLTLFLVAKELAELGQTVRWVEIDRPGVTGIPLISLAEQSFLGKNYSTHFEQLWPTALRSCISVKKNRRINSR